MKAVNITLSVVAAVIAIMFVQILVISQQNTNISARLNQASRTVATGQNDYAALRALASRVNDAATADTELKAVLDRLQLHVTAASSTAAAVKPTH